MLLLNIHFIYFLNSDIIDLFDKNAKIMRKNKKLYMTIIYINIISLSN